MEVKVVRGYKLKLWKDRLNLSPAFVDMIDVYAMNYVHLEIPDNGNMQVILLTKIKGSENPISVAITMTNEIANSLLERIELKNA